MSDHDRYMNLAINVACRNPTAPFGAILVDRDSGETVSEGVNRANENPIMHGEIDAICNYARQHIEGWDKLRLYSTAEPCSMCQSAILWAGIPEVVFGVSIARLMDLGWSQIDLSAKKVVSRAGFAKCVLVGGVLAEKCDELFRRARE